jgi:hypothetical protein
MSEWFGFLKKASSGEKNEFEDLVVLSVITRPKTSCVRPATGFLMLK